MDSLGLGGKMAQGDPSVQGVVDSFEGVDSEVFRVPHVLVGKHCSPEPLRLGLFDTRFNDHPCLGPVSEACENEPHVQST